MPERGQQAQPYCIRRFGTAEQILPPEFPSLVRDACGPAGDSEHGRSPPRSGSYLMRQHCEREVSWQLVRKL